MTKYQHYQPMHMTLHERCFPHRVMENIWIWSVHSEKQNIHYNSYLIHTEGSQSFIVDPVAAGPEVLDGLTPLPKPTCIVLTTGAHEREALSFKERLNIPIMISEAAASGLSFRPDSTFNDADVLPGGWQAILLPDQDTPGECALYQPDRKILIVGDALVGKPFQFLSLPADIYAGTRRSAASIHNARQGLRRLLDLDIRAILPGSGDPVMQNVHSLLKDVIETH